MILLTTVFSLFDYSYEREILFSRHTMCTTRKKRVNFGLINTETWLKPDMHNNSTEIATGVKCQIEITLSQLIHSALRTPAYGQPSVHRCGRSIEIRWSRRYSIRGHPPEHSRIATWSRIFRCSSSSRFDVARVYGKRRHYAADINHNDSELRRVSISRGDRSFGALITSEHVRAIESSSGRSFICPSNRPFVSLE